MFYQWQGRTLILSIRIQPNASSNALTSEISDNQVKVRLKAAPVDGKANKELTRFLAKLFGVTQSDITLLSGHKNRNKRVSIIAPRFLPDSIKDEH